MVAVATHPVADRRRSSKPRRGRATPWLHVSDEELMLTYRAGGDASAFEQLVHRYEGELYAYLYRYLRDRNLAEELFQTVCLRLHERASQFQSGRRFRPWLYSIATHLAVDHFRRAGRRQVASLDAERTTEEGDSVGLLDLLAADTESPSARIERQERREWIRNAVGELPQSLRSVVLLTYYQGLSYQEAADALEIPLGTVKSRLHGAIDRLQRAWKQGGLAD
jgi:RNA polymerase sigma-70 factor (ECF subfamily)